jgi:hypothetical protein
LPGTTNTFFSFSFWIRSKWPQFTNLEVTWRMGDITSDSSKIKDFSTN